ncbi:MAG: hypothetical protein ABS81_00710 [Pseudonocardia sp. SCN 72-86]|nr:MAG: hypothetical protein ABS81_00710 [Pseudonocardia sp. SCN 72-86]
MNPILDGVRVVDLTTCLAGPLATRILAEQGADVLKVEPPDGDPARSWCPAGFAAWNRSKTGVALDLTVDADRRVLDTLLAAADVLVHDRSQAQARTWGLDDESLASRHPHLVTAAVTGYPDGHPDEGRPADEWLVQARLGAMDEQQALRPGPMFIRLPFASHGAALLLAGGVVARLFERLGTERGRSVRTSLLQAALAPASLYWQRAGNPPEWLSRNTLRRDDHPSNLTIFECSDRWLHVLGGFSLSSVMQEVLAEAGESELAPQGVTRENRGRWEPIFRTRTVDEWCRLLWAAGVICVPVLDVGEVLGLEQARLNGYAVEVDDDRFGRTVQAGAPLTTAPPAVVRCGAPWTPAPVDEVRAAWSERGPRAVLRHGPAPAEGMAGVRVLDLGSYVAGPFGGQCLADFGADVVKIEAPWGERGRQINQFTGSQRGKRSLAMDLRDERTRPLLRRLLAEADVVTHNIREAAARKLGIDEDSVRAVNPDAVYVHATAYGDVGPWAEFGGFDPAAAALGGWTKGIVGPRGRPTWLRNSSMDTHTGLTVFLAAALGLYQRATTGRAGRTSTSLLAVAVSSASEAMLAGPGLELLPIVPVDEDQTGVSPHHRIYRAGAGWVAVAALTSVSRKALLEVAGVDDEADLGAALATREVKELVAAFDDAGVPAEVVAQSNRDAFFDRELAMSSRLVERSETVPYGWFENPGGYWSEASGVLRSRRPVPGVGQHTVEILREAGVDGSDVEAGLAAGYLSETQIAAPSGRAANTLTRSLNR